MNETPRIAHLEPSDTAVIRLEIPRKSMPEVMGPAINELIGAIGAQGVEISGPLFAHHFAMSPETFDFELGFPVTVPIAAAGRVAPGKRPPARVARTVYHGPYEGLPDAWAEFHAWIESQQLEWASDIWEVYAKGPQTDPDPATWETELNRPLVA
jgi:effector-binding domain-containing protein